ncbi:MAG: sodium/solute symporter [bacterium]|nr:sodium/solute symporter [bacterium]
MDEVQGAQNLVSGLSGLDFWFVGGAIALLFIIAYITGKKEEDTEDFFLGKRRVPMIIATLSFVATEISALTIIGVPATGFRENWHYLQFFIGSALSRIAVAFLFIPVFYKYNCTTIYEFLKHRFGVHSQYSGSIFFFITRLMASGVRLYATCLAVSVIMGWTLGQSLLLFTAVSIIFIAFGGIKAVVWTGAFEAMMFFVGGFVLIGYLYPQIQGGMAEIWRIAGEGGRTSLFNLKLNINDPTTLLIAILNGFFGSLAAFGTDQEMVQRLLTVKTRQHSQRAIISTILGVFPLVCIYLAIGTLLYVFYQQRPALPLPDNSDKILSHFVLYSLPFGLKGLILATIILASIDSPLSSLTSSFVTDIYRPLIKKHASEKHYLWMSRIMIIVFGLILAGIAFLCQFSEGILWLAFKITSLTYGSLLGVFLFGILTKRVANKANILAMVVNAICMAVLLVLSELKIIGLGWSWLVVIGTIFTFGLSYLLGPIMDKKGSVPA